MDRDQSRLRVNTHPHPVLFHTCHSAASLLRPCSWGRSFWAEMVRRVSNGCFIRPLLRVFTRVRIDGAEHLKELDGPVIFASNHQSNLDAHLLIAALPEGLRDRVAPAICDECFGGRSMWLRWGNRLRYYTCVLFANAFTMPRAFGFRASLRHISDLARHGWSVLIFPEGERSPEMQDFQPGIGVVIAHSRLPVVPVRLTGLYRVLEPGSAIPRRGPVGIRFGRPMRLDGSDYHSLTLQVEQAIRDLGE